jgi:hypothetical protein
VAGLSTFSASPSPALKAPSINSWWGRFMVVSLNQRWPGSSERVR